MKGDLQIPILLVDVQSLMDESGVYEIVCTENGRVYIGQSGSILARARSHVQSLKCGSHSNNLLQHDWDKYDETKFMFRIVTKVPAENKQELLGQESKEIERRQRLGITTYNEIRYTPPKQQDNKSSMIAAPDMQLPPSKGTEQKRKHTGRSTMPPIDNKRTFACFDCGSIGYESITLFVCHDNQYRCQTCINIFLERETEWLKSQRFEYRQEGKKRFRWMLGKSDLTKEIHYAMAIYAHKYNCLPQTILFNKEAKIIDIGDDFNVMPDKHTPRGYVDFYIPI